MFVYLSKKIAIPNGELITCLSWDHNNGNIAVGCTNKFLKVLKLESNEAAADPKERGLAAPPNLVMNQALDGHEESLVCVTWNEKAEKLTSCDAKGLIIVWMLYKGQWFEEMVNSRNVKACDMKWAANGHKVCICYADSTVIVGSLEGSRIWAKEIGSLKFAKIEWSPTGKQILFGLQNGEVHVYDSQGVFAKQIVIHCMKYNVKDDDKGEDNDEESKSITTSEDARKLVDIQWYSGRFGYQPHCPFTLMVAYRNGCIQLQSNENAEVRLEPGDVSLMSNTGIINSMPRNVYMIVRSDMLLSSARWSHDGSHFALAGKAKAANSGQLHNTVNFYTNGGDLLRSLRLPGENLTSLAWERHSLRLALGIDHLIYFANVRPDYKWCHLNDTVCYSFSMPLTQSSGSSSAGEQFLMFWNYKHNHCVLRPVKNIAQLASGGDFCCFVTRLDDDDEKLNANESKDILAGENDPLPNTQMKYSLQQSQEHQYMVTICNSLGTSMDSRFVDIPPQFISMTSTHVVLASRDAFYTWQYVDPRRVGAGAGVATSSASMIGGSGGGGGVVGAGVGIPGREKLHHIDETPSGAVDHYLDWNKVFQKPTSEPISAITASADTLIVARQMGTLQIYSLPQVALTERQTLEVCRQPPHLLELNSNSTQLAVVDSAGFLSVFTIIDGRQVLYKDHQVYHHKSNGGFDGKKADEEEEEVAIAAKSTPLEKKDVWHVKWAEDMPETLCFMEKTKLVVSRSGQLEEPVVCCGHISRFNDLTVEIVLLDELLKCPTRPPPDGYIKIESKQLKDFREVLSSSRSSGGASSADIQSAIEKRPHSRLWRLWAEDALLKLDLSTAEKAFVRCRDYAGVQFVKHCKQLHNDKMRRAQVNVYFEKYDAAEKLYLDMDRLDLAISLRKKLGDWLQVIKLLKSESIAGSDRDLTAAWNSIAEFFAQHQHWQHALTYYTQARNTRALVKCHFQLEDFTSLEGLADQLPDGDTLLLEIGAMFQGIGRADAAVRCYCRAAQPRMAVECCIQLNRWSLATKLSKEHALRDTDALLNSQAKALLQRGKFVTAIELFRTADRNLDAAKLVFKCAEKFHAKHGMSRPSVLKKIYVLGALLVEKHQQQTKQKQKQKTTGAGLNSLLNNDDGGSRRKNSANERSALNGFLELSSSIDDTNLIAGAWKGAEACHFLILTHKYLYSGQFAPAHKVSLKLLEYPDFIDSRQANSLIALVACASRHFTTVSSALSRLTEETESNLSVGGGANGGSGNRTAVMTFGKHGSSNNDGAKTSSSSSPGAAVMQPSGVNTKHEVNQLKELAVDIFTKNIPKDERVSRHCCPCCDSQLADWLSVCPTCDTAFSYCVVTGRPLPYFQFWVCPSCKHRANETDIVNKQCCPLCHSSVTAGSPDSNGGGTGTGVEGGKMAPISR